MNRKGFTLIELLATIAILALLMLVAVPNVMSTIDKNKQDTYIEDAKRMITLAEYKVRSDTNIELPTSGNCIVVPLGSLDLTDFTEGPEGGNDDLVNSYVVVGRTGSSYEYSVTIVENYDCSTGEDGSQSCSSKRGLSLITEDDLNKGSARNSVYSNDDLNVVTPSVGLTLGSYTVTNIIDS